MEILKENYPEFEPRLFREIETCAFLSIDLELSGLHPTLETLIDTPFDRYLKYKQICERYSIIQWGIVTFHKNFNNTYSARPYNIYIFPYEEYNNNKLEMEVSAIIFNRDHKTDFNKWIHHGVPYLNKEQQKKVSDRMVNDNINIYDPDNPKLMRKITWYKPNDKEKYMSFLKEFQDFFQDTSRQELQHEKLQKHIWIYFLNQLDTTTRNNIFINLENKSIMVITKMSKDRKKMAINKEQSDALKKLKLAKGVKCWFDKIIESKKIVVGHNCIIDFMFCWTHFLEELPINYRDFKTSMIKDYGGIYDTKYWYHKWNSDNIGKQSFHLEEMYKDLYSKNKDKVVINIMEGFKNYWNPEETEMFHQADYDAFVTGASYLYMIEQFGNENVQKYLNVFNLMNSVYDGFNLNCDEHLKGDCTKAFVIKAENVKEFDLKVHWDDKYRLMIHKIYYYEKDNVAVYWIKDDK